MIKSSLKILTGSGFAILIGFISLPFLTRLYSPESFGNLQLFQTIMLYCIVYSSFRYEVTLLTVDDNDVEEMTLLCFVLTGFAFLLTLLAFLLFILTEIGARHIDVLVWIPIAILIAGISQIFSYLGQRYRNYSLLSKSKVTQASVNSLSSVLFGFFEFVSNGLIISDLLGRIAYSINLKKFLPKIKKINIMSQISNFKILVVEHRALPLLAIPGGFVNIAGGTLTSIMMFMVFSPQTAGQFFLAEKVVILPFGLVAASVSQVFSSEFASLTRSGSASGRNIYWNIVCKMGLLGIIPCIAIYFLSESVFGLLFGEEWMVAASMAKVMSFLMLANFMVTPVNMTMMILGNQGMQLIWETVRLIVMSCAWYLIYHLQIESIIAIHVHVICSVLLAILFVCMTDSQIRIFNMKSSV